MIKHWKNIVMAIGIAYALGIVLFPSRFLTFNLSFVDYVDSVLSYAGAFQITNALMHGGIQLWDWYDQMPMTFYNLNFSMYKFSNVITAIVYALCSPFVHDQAQFFHQLFSFLFTFTTLAVRCIGIYLLLSLFATNRWILIIVSAYASTLMSAQFLLGLSTNIIYSLFPLILYFLLRFFKEKNFEMLFLFVAAWIYCIATDFFCGLGYLYQAIHFVIVPGIVWMIFYHRRKIWPIITFDAQKNKRLLLLGVVAALMILPSIYLVKANYHDYEFGLESSRMKDPLSVTAYFKRPAAWAAQSEFLSHMVDFSKTQWLSEWIALGCIAVFFTLLGLIVLPDSRKWILFASIIFFFLMNSPRDASGLSGAAHWINALTNPLKFLPRSMGMSFGYTLPFLMMPLVVAGIEWLWQRQKNAWPLAITFVVWLVFVGMTFKGFNQEVRIFVLAMSIGFLGIIALKEINCRNNLTWVPKAIVVLMACLFSVDAWALSQYYQRNIKPAILEPRPVSLRPELPGVEMDFQNPSILPIRHFFSLLPTGDKDKYLYQQPYNMPGMIYRYTNHWRYLQGISNYLPRHQSFGKWMDNPWLMHQSQKQSLSMMFLAAGAIKDEGNNFEGVVSQGLYQHVVTIDGYPGELPPITPPSKNNIEYTPKGMTVPWPQLLAEKKKNFTIGRFRTPKDLPNYRASTFFTEDEKFFNVKLGTQSLLPVQGRLLSGMTYDVNNIREGFVHVAIPNELWGQGEGIVFDYLAPGPNGMQKVFKNEMDQMGFVYNAAYDGWLFIAQPYDKKWQIKLNGKKVPFYKAHKSFIAFPITAGEHNVLIQYWPNSPIRILLGLSVVAMTVFLVWLLLAAVKTRLSKP